MNKVTVTLDQDIEGTNYLAGSQISYNDGLYTPDDGYAFYISQFAKVESKIYEAKYANITYAELIPVDPSYPEWADSWDYISFDGVTMGKFIGASAKDLPQVGLQANKTSVPIGYAGNSFGYSLDELRKSQQTRIPLDTTKGRLAFRGAQEHTQQVAYFGDASRGMSGLFNNPNLGLDSSTIDYSTATGQEMVSDLNGILNDVWMESANIHVPNVLVIPASIFTIITEKRMDSGTDTTVLQFFMKNNLFFNLTGGQLRVIARLQLEADQLAANGVNNGGKYRMLAYELNDENLGMVNPIPWRALAPQMEGLEVNTPCEYKISGVDFRFPFSGRYRDGK